MKVNLPLKQAQNLSDKITAALSPGCQRIQSAGSVRRQKETIGDLEIVCIPSPTLRTGAGPSLDDIIDDLIDNGRLERGDKNGKKFKNFLIPAVPGLKLDLFIPTIETWGVIFTIRTGSAEFSQKLVTQQSKGGFLPNDLRVKDGRIWRGDVALPTPNEEDVFKLLGWWIEPERRTADFRPSSFDVTQDVRQRLVLMNRIGQAHLEPGMSLDKMKRILREADIGSLDSASDEELEEVWQVVENEKTN